MASGSRTEDGFEVNMGVNHFGHFLLTNLLLDLLKASAPSRIVVVASAIHKYGTIDKENLNAEKFFPGSWKGYGNSKLANILFANELSRKLEGTMVVINSCCPGPVCTDVTKNLNFFMRSERFKSQICILKISFFLNRTLMRPMMRIFYKTPINGAQTQIMLAVEPECSEVTGKYFTNCKETEPSEKTKDIDLAKWIFDRSSELVGLSVA